MTPMNSSIEPKPFKGDHKKRVRFEDDYDSSELSENTNYVTPQKRARTEQYQN